jgi:hypothetical protein
VGWLPSGTSFQRDADVALDAVDGSPSLPAALASCLSWRRAVGQVVTMGLDIAKSVFQVRGVDTKGAVVIWRKFTRARLLSFRVRKLNARLDGERPGQDSNFAAIGIANNFNW